MTIELLAEVKILKEKIERYEKSFDKIRAEIADLDNIECEFEGYYKAVNDALQIIDKYRESEDKE